MQEQVTIGAIRFQFLPDEQGWRFDSIPFYTSCVKDFLLANEGDAVWVKGGIVKREAYLMFKSSIKEETIDLVKKSICSLTRIKITPMKDPYRLFDECLRKKRTFIGYLEFGSQKLGRPKKPTITVKMRDNYCFLCPFINDGKCTLEGYRGDCAVDRPFLMDGSYGMMGGNLANCGRIRVVVDGRL